MRFTHYRRDGSESSGRDLELSLKTMVNGVETTKTGSVCKAMLNGRKYPMFYSGDEPRLNPAGRSHRGKKEFHPELNAFITIDEEPEVQ